MIQPLGKNALTLAASLVVAFASARGAEPEWRQFRGPTGQGISAAINLPITWSATEHVAWKVALPGTGWSSPVLSKGRLYLTNAVVSSPDAGGAVSLHAMCLDAEKGDVLWNAEIFRPDAASLAAMHRKNSPASATPIITDERLYVHFGHMGTAALDLGGKIVWTQNEVRYAPVHGNASSPVLVGDALIFNADGASDPFVAALDATTGAVRWKTPRNTIAKKTFSFSTPLAIDVDGASQVISSGSAMVASYDPQDGREIWRVTYPEGYSVVPRPSYAHGLVFVSSAFDAPVVYAIRPQGAKGDVTATNVAWSIKKGAPNTPSMVVLGGEIYFVSDAGIATCADAKTGAVHWTERLGGDFSASPTAAERRIYFFNETGVGFVVKAGKTFELLAKNELGEQTFASPAVADRALFIRSEAHLWKIVP